VGHGTPQALIRRPLNAEAGVLSQASPCGICYGKSDIGTGSSLYMLVLNY